MKDQLLSRRSVAGMFALPFAASAQTPPNVILIYADDLGYGDLGCYGSSNETPNLDRMAREGARFTQFYSANPVCSPSRAALLTGRYPTRVGVSRVLFPNDKTGLAEGETTIAQMLKARNYKTACIGKWHLGHLPPHLPTFKGFDQYFGIPYSNDMNPRVLLRAVGDRVEQVEEQATLETLTPRYTEEALRFIEQSKGSPFFLYMPHTYPHIPLGASTRFRGKSPNGIYGDVMAELDWSVGEILSTLRKNGLDQNTLVLFSSDNGPWHQGSPGRLRGRKGSTLEGGVRVPLLARFPGRIPAGKTCTGVAGTIDILPTIAKLCGVSLPAKPVDGIDIWPLLSGKQKSIEREALLYFDGWNLQCARWGKWKLHFSRHNVMVYNPAPAGGRQNLPLPALELYNLERDAEESYDVAEENPRVVAEITKRVEGLLAGFPEEVKTAWAETRARQVQKSAAGAVPRLKP